MRKILALVSILAFANCGYAQNVNKLIKERKVKRIIKTLSGDDMQGRGTFTPGIEKAATFIEDEFKSIGLTPFKNNANFRQGFTMNKITPTKLEVNINGKIVQADNIAAFSNSSFSWNDTGAEIVKVSADMTFPILYKQLLKNGKKQLVVVDPAFKDFFTRLSAFSRQEGAIFKDAETAPPVIFVLGKFDEIKNYMVNYEIRSTEVALNNVIGVLPGKSKPEEYVVFSGHYDHLGIIEAIKGDSIANGADDDASGTTAVITLAKYFKKLDNNARTLIFVAFTAEELGGYGSQYFSKQLQPDKVVAMFNIEMIGKASKFGENSAFITGFERSDFGTILQKNLQGTDFKFYPDPYPTQNLFYRSDNATLARLGVPAHTISTDQIDIDKLYHTVKDEFSSLDVKNITATIKAIALSSRGIVAGVETPTRVAKLEQ